MKKSLIATAGVAAFAVAAIPAAVFAATTDTQNNFTDNLTLTVQGGCTFKSTVLGDYSRDFTATIAAGHDGEFTMASGEGSMSVACNVASGSYSVQAVGGTTIDPEATGYGTTVLSNGTQADDIATGTTFSGDTSAWAFKVNTTGAASAYTDWALVPNELTTVATNSASSAKTAAVSFTPSYHAYAKANQTAGQYTGAVSYTIVQPQ